jgi:hypothetical protein
MRNDVFVLTPSRLGWYQAHGSSLEALQQQLEMAIG